MARPAPKVLSTFATAREMCDAPDAGDDRTIAPELESDCSMAPHDTCGAAKLRMAARTNIALIETILPLYDEPLLFEVRPHAIAQFALQFHAIPGN